MNSPLDLKVVDRPESAPRTALETTVGALDYLITQFELYGKLDQINMAHAYSAAALGHVVLALEQLRRDDASMSTWRHEDTPHSCQAFPGGIPGESLPGSTQEDQTKCHP